uniref:Uncharacterized protein n=1 Tax=Parascaris univalens TaxID=6257 RepID=A0A915CKJ6_PARUN
SSGACFIAVLLFRGSPLKDSLMKFGIHGCKCHAQNPSVVSDFFICAVLFLVCGCVPRSFRCSQGDRSRWHA